VNSLGGECLILLGLEQKRAILNSYPDIIEIQISQDRYNYEFRLTKQRHKNVACELNQNGNGYVIGRYFKHDYNLTNDGWFNIAEFSEEELRTIIIQAMGSLINS
jgi:hypothetical protein